MTMRATEAPWGDYEVAKAELIGGLRGTVLELGAGRGANFSRLAADVEWIGLEPHASTRRALVRTAGFGRLKSAKVLAAPAENIPLPEASVDAVLSTVVLCSVTDLVAVLAEVRRVLRPGGQFVFFEHVAAPQGSWLYRLQRVAAPVTRRFDKGCNPARDIASAIQLAGFASVDLHRYVRPGPLRIPFIAGTAVRAALRGRNLRCGPRPASTPRRPDLT
ncbi:class I SAM-dependent methyltransferase [Kribbella qitaiheensis]|uniref:Class I SAM-dependent methyltransferase n=1 Tax=Kribbella qitaiheensis TaxID=1544730 RepID=A0A7G6WRW1_9ACTN|nr:class I SAM-dependent methyltransferase [Kribbella qitaiheensis]QNE16726.1 class I SAM-dependent methyltransferase [Kribbella qitaiheensis]